MAGVVREVKSIDVVHLIAVLIHHQITIADQVGVSHDFVAPRQNHVGRSELGRIVRITTTENSDIKVDLVPRVAVKMAGHHVERNSIVAVEHPAASTVSTDFLPGNRQQQIRRASAVINAFIVFTTPTGKVRVEWKFMAPAILCLIQSARLGQFRCLIAEDIFFVGAFSLCLGHPAIEEASVYAVNVKDMHLIGQRLPIRLAVTVLVRDVFVADTLYLESDF